MGNWGYNPQISGVMGPDFLLVGGPPCIFHHNFPDPGPRTTRFCQLGQIPRRILASAVVGRFFARSSLGFRKRDPIWMNRYWSTSMRVKNKLTDNSKKSDWSLMKLHFFLSQISMSWTCLPRSFASTVTSSMLCFMVVFIAVTSVGSGGLPSMPFFVKPLGARHGWSY